MSVILTLASTENPAHSQRDGATMLRDDEIVRFEEAVRRGFGPPEAEAKG